MRLTLRTPTGLFPLGATTRFNNDIELPLPLTSPVLSADCSGDKLQEETSDSGRGCASRRTQRGSRPSTGQEVGEGLRVCVPAAARRQRRLPARLVRRGERPIPANLGEPRPIRRMSASLGLSPANLGPCRRRATLSGASTPPRSPSSKPPSSRAPQGLDLEAAAELASPPHESCLLWVNR